MYSCSRDWRLSASWGTNWVPSWNPSNHHSTIIIWSLRGLLISPPLCRETVVWTAAAVIFFPFWAEQLKSNFASTHLSNISFFEKQFFTSEKNDLKHMQNNILIVAEDTLYSTRYQSAWPRIRSWSFSWKGRWVFQYYNAHKSCSNKLHSFNILLTFEWANYELNIWINYSHGTDLVCRLS